VKPTAKQRWFLAIRSLVIIPHVSMVSGVHGKKMNAQCLVVLASSANGVSRHMVIVLVVNPLSDSWNCLKNAVAQLVRVLKIAFLAAGLNGVCALVHVTELEKELATLTLSPRVRVNHVRVILVKLNLATQVCCLPMDSKSHQKGVTAQKLQWIVYSQSGQNGKSVQKNVGVGIEKESATLTLPIKMVEWFAHKLS